MPETREAQSSITRSFEILFLLVILGILFTIVVLSLNPAKGISGARDSQRQYDVFQISGAIFKFLADNHTLEELETSAGPIQLCEFGASGIGTEIGNVDLLKILVDDYLFAMPVDPADGCNYNDTCYDICKDGESRIKVSAPLSETFKVESFR